MGNSPTKEDHRARSSDTEGLSVKCKQGKDSVSAGSQKDAFRGKFDDLKLSPISDTNENYIPTVFKWENGGKEVLLCGSFSEWKPLHMVKSNGDFVLILLVPEGSHQYRFKVDGKWMHSPNQDVVDNTYGTKNNIKSVKKSDSEAVRGDSSTQVSPPTGYCLQDMLKSKRDKELGFPSFENAPYAQRSVLSREVPLQSGYKLLPKANHTTRHLYELNKTDRISVFGGSHRYNNKFITTVIYRPL